MKQKLFTAVLMAIVLASTPVSAQAIEIQMVNEETEKPSGVMFEVTSGRGNGASSDSISINLEQLPQDKIAPGIVLNPWENLTYKGGMNKYYQLIRNGIEVSASGATPLNGWLAIDGYIVGVPFVSSGSTVKPTPPIKKEEVKKEEVKKEEVTEKLTDKDVEEIKSAISSSLRYLASTRDELKISNFITKDQADEVTKFIKARNDIILKLDANGLDKMGNEAIRKLMPNLIKAEKMKVSDIKVLSATEVSAIVELPVMGKFQMIPDSLKELLGKEYDTTNVKGIPELLSNPLVAKEAMDKTVYETDMKFFKDLHTAGGIKDLYTMYPAAYTTGTMQLRIVKEKSGWRLDTESLVLNANIDGADARITFYR